MTILQISLSEEESEGLKRLAQLYGFRSRSGPRTGDPSVPGLIKALASGERLTPEKFEWPESYEVVGREDWDAWWRNHYPPPEKGSPAYKNWQALKSRRWRDFSYRQALEDTAHFGSWLSEVEGLQEMLLVLSRWFRMRRRLRHR